MSGPVSPLLPPDHADEWRDAGTEAGRECDDTCSKRLSRSILPNVFLPFALGASLHLVACAAAVRWAGWEEALDRGGGRAAVYGWLLASLPIFSALGHLLLGDMITIAQGLEPCAASRMFQTELGFISLAVGLTAAVGPLHATVDAGCADRALDALAFAWGVFLVCAGLRHASARGPATTWTADLYIGSLLVAIAAT
jgi:hypothetical protein